jgi:quinol monooxygenase YgiN
MYMAKDLIVLALFKAKDSMEEKVKAELMGLIKPTRAEKGCSTYILHQDLADRRAFMFYEVWAGKDALDAHIKTGHLMAIGSRLKGLLTEPPQVTQWEVAA